MANQQADLQEAPLTAFYASSSF